MDKTNVNGRAIAVGHPLGASGAILMNRLLYELERRDLRYGLETMCCGGGLGTATITAPGVGGKSSRRSATRDRSCVQKGSPPPPCTARASPWRTGRSRPT